MWLKRLSGWTTGKGRSLSCTAEGRHTALPAIPLIPTPSIQQRACRPPRPIEGGGQIGGRRSHTQLPAEHIPDVDDFPQITERYVPVGIMYPHSGYGSHPPDLLSRLLQRVFRPTQHPRYGSHPPERSHQGSKTDPGLGSAVFPAMHLSLCGGWSLFVYLQSSSEYYYCHRAHVTITTSSIR